MNFSDQNLDDARASLRRLYTALDKVEAGDGGAPDWSEPRAAAFREAMNDDFNTPIAVAVLFELAARSTEPSRRGRAAAQGAGVGPRHPAAGAARLPAGGQRRRRGGISRRIEERRAAKSAGDYAGPTRSGRAWPRKGIVLKDSAAGTTWVRA